MSAIKPVPLKDVQSNRDVRRIPIDRVGVIDLRYPIVVLDQTAGRQETVASFSLSVSLPHHFKGTHMSRFIEVLSAHSGEITMRTLPRILHSLKERLNAEAAHMEVHFPYFVKRAAPATSATALMDYECFFVGESNGVADDVVLGVQVPVTSLCPCSKAISDYGAHNQRGYVTIEVRSETSADGAPELIWIEELVDLAECSASAPVYPLLKRPDERHVTMQAYDNPAFVEDVVRSVAVKLQRDRRVGWFRVHVLNQESIHNYNAFAELSWTRSAHLVD